MCTPRGGSTRCRATARPRCASTVAKTTPRPRPRRTRRRRGRRALLCPSTSCRARRRPCTSTCTCWSRSRRRSCSERSRHGWRRAVKENEARFSDEHRKSAENTRDRREGVRRAAHLAFVAGIAHRFVRIGLAASPPARLLGVALDADQGDVKRDKPRGPADARRVLLRTGEAPTPALAASRSRGRHGGRRRRRRRLGVRDVVARRARSSARRADADGFVIRQRPALARGVLSRGLGCAPRVPLLAERAPLHLVLFDPGGLVVVPQRLRRAKKINASGARVAAIETRTAVRRRRWRRSRKRRYDAGRERVRTTKRIARLRAFSSLSYLESRFSSLVSGSTVAAARPCAPAGSSIRGNFAGRGFGSSTTSA